MYASHWGLQDSPFGDDFDPRFFYQSSTHEEALARLQFLVERGHRLGLLVGESGSGKSFVLSTFARELKPKRNEVVQITLLGLQPRELLWKLNAHLGVNPRPRDETIDLWRRLADRLAENHYQQLPTILLLDGMEPALSIPILRLAHGGDVLDSRCTVVLAVDKTRVREMDPQLLELVNLRIELDPWASTDAREFVETMLGRVGAQSPIFTPDALGRLHELGGGNPRRTKQLVDLALLAGAGQNVQKIDVGTINAVHEELSMSV